MTRIGSLCSGYTGLDMAISAVLGGELAWVADNDAGPVAILAHRYPDVPNLGDITAIDWATVPPVDILGGGFPCENVSCAGGRAGLRAGTSSGVWSHFPPAIAALRPRLVVIENVGGLLSAGADSNMEPCPWCLGEAGDEHVLRAAGAVLGDLASIGYDARWTVVSAAEAGAPHLRKRVFILAWPAADAERDGRPGRYPGSPGTPDAQRSRPWPATAGLRTDAAEDPNGATGREWRIAAPGQAPGGRPRADAGGPGGARTAADASSPGLEVRPVEHHGPQRPAAERSDREPPADADGSGRRLDRGRERQGGQGQQFGLRAAEHQPGDIAWGAYGPAIERWESALGRRSPRPTEPGRTGERLSPRFVEWLMGLPDGWVTDVPGLSRNAQLKALGNGVVPAQAALALRLLLNSPGLGAAA